jgi:predicted transcriptional regulator
VQLLRKQTYITPEQDRGLKLLAERYQTTEADILRRALESWIALETARQDRDPFEGIIGFVAGPAQVDHDDIYR